MTHGFLTVLMSSCITKWLSRWRSPAAGFSYQPHLSSMQQMKGIRRNDGARDRTHSSASRSRQSERGVHRGSGHLDRQPIWPPYAIPRYLQPICRWAFCKRSARASQSQTGLASNWRIVPVTIRPECAATYPGHSRTIGSCLLSLPANSVLQRWMTYSAHCLPPRRLSGSSRAFAKELVNCSVRSRHRVDPASSASDFRTASMIGSSITRFP